VRTLLQLTGRSSRIFVPFVRSLGWPLQSCRTLQAWVYATAAPMITEELLLAYGA